MCADEDLEGSELDQPFRSFFDLSTEELDALKKQRQLAIEQGLVPTVAPNVFEILMRDEVIENAEPFAWVQRHKKQAGEPSGPAV